MNTTDSAALKAEEKQENHFRVSIFGSARTKPEEQVYQDTHAFAKRLAEQNIGVVTGGGPGIMEAGNAGHKVGNNGNTKTIGLTIRLPFETEGNTYMDIHEHYEKFSPRLDEFMRLSNAIVVMPGGIGTCLELFYTWQLIQVKHTCNIPVILVGDMWVELLKWIRKYPMDRNLMSPQDMNLVVAVENLEEAEKIIQQAHKDFEKHGDDFCLNVHKYL